jgi:hypothetical protein
MRRSIDFWYGRRQAFGHLGRPQRWVNVLGTVDPVGLRQLRYRVGDGPERPLSVGPDGLRLRAPGDFNVEILYDDLAPGTYVVSFRAEYEDAGLVDDRVELEIAPRCKWPLPYHIKWRDIDSIGDAVQIVDGRWTKTPAGIRPVYPHYDRLVAIGDVDWTDYEAEVPVTFHGFCRPASGEGQRGGFGLLFRWSGHHADEFQPSREWRPNGAIAWYRALWERKPAMHRNLNISDAVVKDESLAGTAPLQLDLDVPYVMQFAVRSRPGSTGEYRYRTWPASNPDAPVCDLVATAREGEAPTGSILLIALYADVTIGDVVVRPIE